MIEIDTLGGNCPVQAEGRIDDQPFTSAPVASVGASV